MKKYLIIFLSLLAIIVYSQKSKQYKYKDLQSNNSYIITTGINNSISEKGLPSNELNDEMVEENTLTFATTSLLSQKNEIEITKNNSLIKRYYFEILINDRFAEKYTKISIPYSKKNKILELEAHIKGTNGDIIRVLKKNEITEKSNISDISLYEDNMVKEFTLTHNIYPYTICYSYKQEEKEFLYVDYWIPVLDPQIPTLSAELKLTIPVDYPISISQDNLNDPEITEDKGQKKYLWKTSYTKLVSKELLSPPVHFFLPYVKIVPEVFKYDKKGSLTNWISFGNWEVELLKGLNDIPQWEKNRTDRILVNITNKREQIKALYHYLQDGTRYINVAIDKGGLKPFPASYVSTNKYGDCKALTNYMKSLLEQYQIKSYYTNVYAGDVINKIDKAFPSQQFNHVILFIPLDNDSIWLDCTSKGPFNYLGTFSQNRDAFVIDDNNSFFIKTPSLMKEEVLSTRTISVNPSNSGTAELSFLNTYRGKLFEILNSSEVVLSKNEQKKFIQDYIVGNKDELLSHEIIKRGRDDSFVQLNYKTISSNIHKMYGNDFLISNISFELPPLEKPTERQFPIQINYPVYEIDTITYNLPSEFILEKKLEGQNIESKFGQYKADYIYNDNSIIVIKSFFLNSGYYENNDYNDLFLFIEEIKNIQNSTIFTLTKQKS